MTKSSRRVAIINDTSSYVGPDLARALAGRGHDLVIGDPHDGLVEELQQLGATVEVVAGVGRLRSESDATTLVDRALQRFGQIDSAAMFSGQIIGGSFLKSTVVDLQRLYQGCFEAPYHFLKAVTAPMVQRGEGQILVITSASAARPTLMAPLYSSMRAGATMLAKNVAAEVARNGVQVNAVGTNFMDFPAFLEASHATTPEGRARVEAQVPMGRLGTLSEFAAFCMPYVDGTSRFATGQYVSFAGGWA